MDISIEDQIAFLKECYQISFASYMRAGRDERRLRQAERAMTHLHAAIETLQKIKEQTSP